MTQKAVYSIEDVIARLVDGSALLEFHSGFGPQVCTGLVKVDGTTPSRSARRPPSSASCTARPRNPASICPHHQMLLPRLIRSQIDTMPSSSADHRRAPAEGLPVTHPEMLFCDGVALLDNALLEPLAKACLVEGRNEFMLVISPLPVVGGTGSPANPLAVF